MLQLTAIIVFVTGVSVLCLLNQMRKSYWRSVRDHHIRYYRSRGAVMDNEAADISRLERMLQSRRARIRKLEKELGEEC